MSLGENIRRLREDNKLTQKDVAKAIKVTEATISLWESDSRVPRMGAVQQLSDLFNVPMSEIIEGSSGGAVAAFRLLESLSDEKRQEAERYLRYLAREDSPGNPK